jgi:hypothetical protein
MTEAPRPLELRADDAQRRHLGSWFTPDDVSLHVARAPIIAAWQEIVAAEGTEDGLPPIEDLARRPGQASAHLADVCARLSSPDGAQRALASMHVLDPCVGDGAFLLAAWQVLGEIAVAVGGQMLPQQLHGLDIDPAATRKAAERLAAVAGAGAEIVCADATGAILDVLPLLAAAGGAHACVGNPPWSVRQRADTASGLATAACPNVYAHVSERALQATRTSGYAGLVVPISSMCTHAFAPLRLLLGDTCSMVAASHFDTIPASLFDDVVQRLTVLMARRDSGPARWLTSSYMRHARSERAQMLAGVSLIDAPPPAPGGGVLAKVGTQAELDILARLQEQPPLGDLLSSSGDAPIFYKRRWSYFLLFLDHEPPIFDAEGVPRKASECKELHAGPSLTGYALIAILSSSLFWWHFSVRTDNRNVNAGELRSFPCPAPGADELAQLDQLGRRLMMITRENSELRSCTYKSIGTILNTYYRQGPTRSVLDEIDTVLARVQGLDAEQLAFILSFERRWRS